MADGQLQAILAQYQNKPNPWAVANKGIQQNQMPASAYGTKGSPIVAALQGFLGGYTGSRAQAQEQQNKAGMQEALRQYDEQQRQRAMQEYKAKLGMQTEAGVSQANQIADYNQELKQKAFPQELEQQKKVTQAQEDIKFDTWNKQQQAQRKAERDANQLTGASRDLMMDALTRQNMTHQQAEQMVNNPKQLEMHSKIFGTLSEEKQRPYDITSKVRGEFMGTEQYQKFHNIAENFRLISKGVYDRSGMTDFELMRRGTQIIEPGLAVRTDDQKQIEQVASRYGKYRAEIASALRGESKLSPEVRAAIVRMAERAYTDKLANYENMRSRYENEAESRGGFRDRIEYLKQPLKPAQIKAKAFEIFATPGWAKPIPQQFMNADGTMNAKDLAIATKIWGSQNAQR